MENYFQNQHQYQYQNQILSLKIFGIALSFLLILIHLPLFYGIIWYERHGSDLKRIFINKVVSSACWSILAWISVIQIPILVQHVTGHLPTLICFLHLILKNAILIQIVLFYDAIVIVRYISIFVLKNPLSFENDFWFCFVNISVVTFSLLSQTVFVLLPGNQPLDFHLCSKTFETNPNSKTFKNYSNLTGFQTNSNLKTFQSFETNVKTNWPLALILFFSLLLHISANLRIKLYKMSHNQTNVCVLYTIGKQCNNKPMDNNKQTDNRQTNNIQTDNKQKDDRKTDHIQTYSRQTDKKYSAISVVEKLVISDCIANVCILIAIVSSGLFTLYIDQLNPLQAEQLPKVLIVYFYHFFAPFLFTGTIAILYYTRHRPLRVAILRELKSRKRSPPIQKWF